MKRTWHYYLALMAASATWLAVLGACAGVGAFLAVLLIYVG